ncbi:F0F1 ATP synthase subunit A [candidate division WWE3 bacterium]|uniref:ATP synthase subunit a n=1 Tax=candidate division WWE3 bacterium TaxID=2053526 RepID=A0A955RQF6_UNCKA|nr:F0F1 ATP synthase subunit A [candidate division WWE3 bacterium]
MHISIAAEKLTEIAGITITNSLFTAFIVSAFLIIAGYFIGRNVSYVPGKIQTLFEMMIGGIHSLAKSVSPKHADEFFPLIMTLFIFILFSNWFGLIPGISAVGFNMVEHGEEVFVPIFRAATADLNTTLALALVAMAAVWYYGIKHVGIKLHLGKFFTIKSPIDAFVGILEFVGEFAKVISFAFRLFGNIFAGEVLLAVITSLIPIIIPLPFLGLEIFVGFIQAVVFSVLTMVFIASSVEVHH